ncbi:MAG: hypothetical protein HYZ47_01395 [Simkania negevensis]|nr:hypothetical protein [Simkania negevensis]
MVLSIRFFLKIVLTLGILGLHFSDLQGVTGAANDKVYLVREQIVLSMEGILVEVQGKLIPTEAIYRDQKGFYIAPNSFYHPGKEWYCLNCGEINSGWASPCVQCRGSK